MNQSNIQKICSLIVLLVVVFAGCETKLPARAKLSEQAFPDDEFFGGISVDLDGLQNHPRYQLFPLDVLIPANTSFDHLDTELISHFGIFLKHRNETERGAHQRFEVAAIGKLRDPKSFDVQAEVAKWSNRTTPWRVDYKVQLQAIEVAGKSCFKFGSGTILNPIQRQGEVAIFGRDGKKDGGINVGKNDPRRYVAGGDNDSRAEISVGNVTSSDLVDGALVIDLDLFCFRAVRLRDPSVESQIYLLSSDGKTRTEIVDFDVNSHFTHRRTFARQQPVWDVESGAPKGSMDLIDDFVGDGELRIVLHCVKDANYLGVKESDCGLRLPSDEYLGVVGEYVCVAQSRDTLKQMLNQPESQIAEKLALQDGQQLEASFDLAKNQDRTAFDDFLKALKLQHVLSAMTSSTKRVKCSVNMDKDKIFSAEVGMSQKDAKFKSSEIVEFCQHLTESRSPLKVKDVSYKLDDNRGIVTSVLASRVLQSIYLHDQLAALRGMGVRMVMGLPQETLEMRSAGQSFPAEPANRLSLAAPYQELGEKLNNAVQAWPSSDGLRVDFSWPFGDVSQLKSDELTLLATLRRYRSRKHFNFERFFLAEQIERRLVSEFPENQELWKSLAHRQTFNTSIDFCDFRSQYFWVRRGINFLLDIGESDDSSVDAFLKAAEYIVAKIGKSDERKEFGKLFAKDKSLLDRIEKHVNLTDCLDTDGALDCYLVALQLLNFCNQQRQESKNEGWSADDFRLAAAPATMRKSYAHSLDRDARTEAAVKQWQIARKEYEAFGERAFSYGSAGELKVKNLLAEWGRRSEKNELDSLDQICHHAVWYESNLNQIRLRLSPVWSKVSSLKKQAESFQNKKDSALALTTYESALDAVQEYVHENPEQMRAAKVVFRKLLQRASLKYKSAGKPVPEAYQVLLEPVRWHNFELQ